MNQKIKTEKVLLIIFLVTVIPTIIIYLEHGLEENNAFYKSLEKGNDYKATKQLGEAILFYSIAIGYIWASVFVVFVKPNSKIPHIVILVGTVAIIILYYLRIYGIPVIGTDNIIIRDLSTDWRDVITKICQQILVIPISMLLVLQFKNKEFDNDYKHKWQT